MARYFCASGTGASRRTESSGTPGAAFTRAASIRLLSPEPAASTPLIVAGTSGRRSGSATTRLSRTTPILVCPAEVKRASFIGAKPQIAIGDDDGNGGRYVRFR